jgi:Tfp pilus assembly protein PilV
MSFRGEKHKRGVTLVELLLGTAILVFASSGLLSLFLDCLFLNDNSRNSTLAYNAVQSKMEEIRNSSYSNLNNFNGQVFDLTGFSSGNGKGMVIVADEMSNLKKIKVSACFKNHSRLIGNDINSCTSSPVELVSFIAEP